MVSTISKELGINRRTAINYISKLRKKGYVKTTGGRNIRMYDIRPYKEPEIGYPGLYDTINKYSPIKLAASYKHIIYGKKLSIEEAIIRAIKTESYRAVIAILPLFNKVRDWSYLYKLAKKEDVRNIVGALYDLAKTEVRVKKMDKRIRNRLLEDRKKRYLMLRVKAKQYKEISKRWNVEIPFTKGDLMRLKE